MSTDRGKPVIKTDGKLLMINEDDFTNIHERNRPFSKINFGGITIHEYHCSDTTSNICNPSKYKSKVNAKDKIRINIFRIKIKDNIRELLSGEVVSGDTDKSKEPGKWKPIWKVPSKEVATIFDGATRTGISETGARELDDMTFGGEGPPTWPLESYRRKRTYVLELGTRGRKTIVAPNAG
ncbi:hypothetical protein C2G38_2164264 [Gigaspora rosea]|uniref:Uncharacterized protein n=1 Tax=Gigaspora rosea TaxID=44941 RepID=A0A397VXM3_9GLOM|nr:hypothetical protein C2G38_2164264 [Gigaspora rosea]